MRADIGSANLPEKEMALRELVIKSVDKTLEANTNDLGALREMGWSDKDIFDADHHAAKMPATDIMFNTFKTEIDA